MFIAIPSVYCSGPSQPGGVKSGQRPAPSCLENSTWTPLGRSSRTLMVVVIGQLPRSRGELRIITWLIPSLAGAGGTGVGVEGVGAGAAGEDEARRKVSV